MILEGLFGYAVEGVIGYAGTFFGLAGAVIIIYGGLLAVIQIVFKEILRKPLKYSDIRLDFVNKIVFGLDFFIAADILSTLIYPSAEELIILGSVVIIRTILGYFLEKEAKEFRVD